MANINDAFPSEFLKVEDLQNRNATVTISTASIEEIGKGRDRERKIMLGLMGKTKRFVVNKTNAKVIAGLYGPDTDAWIGQRITLTPREVEFQGTMVWAIRVSMTKPQANAPAVSSPPPPPPASATNDEDVPF